MMNRLCPELCSQLFHAFVGESIPVQDKLLNGCLAGQLNDVLHSTMVELILADIQTHETIVSSCHQTRDYVLETLIP